ncbi:hypothetical protein Sango_2753200 [Sesamum angolense]|uniref:Aminotransferase-like plant mobile domain-containing protein n=1 Tax=Sesamum angolense TaxID=2727404 RepID=A0AAE1T7L7_9LAMI|nr:hypothetical protein Sango_2753200 [Sesamum angolense]
MQYIGFVPEDGALKGSRLQVKAIIHHISRVHITPDTPHLTVVQGYSSSPELQLGQCCPGILYRELCNASEKGKAIGGALQLYRFGLVTHNSTLSRTWCSTCTYGPHQIDNNRVLPGAPYGAMWNCEHTFTRTVRTTVRVIRDILDEMQYDQPYDMESNVIMAYAWDFNPQLWRSICPLIFYAIVEMHHPERVLRQFGMMQNIPDQPDTRDMSLHKITVPIVRAQIGFCSTYSTSLYDKDDMTRSYKDNPFPTEEIHIEDIGNVDIEGYRQLVAQLEHEVQIIAEAIKHQPQQTAIPSDSAPTTSHRQRRSSSQMYIGSVERGDIGVDIAGPSTAYTPQDYYVPQPPQDYYVPQPSQDDWFQSTSYMPSHAEAYSSHVDLDVGLDISQPYAPEYNISPVPFPSFSAYRDNVESSSAASSSGLHINSGGDDNDGQNELIQNMGEEIRRPRRQRHRQRKSLVDGEDSVRRSWSGIERKGNLIGWEKMACGGVGGIEEGGDEGALAATELKTKAGLRRETRARWTLLTLPVKMGRGK